MTIHPNYIGCDIAKRHVDLYDPHNGIARRVANQAEALAAFAQALPGDAFVVMEATGLHDRALRSVLAEAGIGFARLNPMQVRRFAEARGRRAKTDQLDARLLSAFGAAMRPAAEAAPCPVRERLAAFARRRDQLVAERAREKRRLADAFDADIIADITAAIAALSHRIGKIEAAIRAQISHSGELAEQAKRLASAPGVGFVTVAALLAQMPELGRLSPKAAASLAGLAPFNDDSGTRRGRRHIGGGRPRLRKALYMAAIGAIRKAERFATAYRQIAERSGSKKLAIIAIARKLLTILNAMQRDKQAFA
jgi:transposase